MSVSLFCFYVCLFFVYLCFWFSKHREKEWSWGGQGNMEGCGGFGGRESMIWIYCKKNTFFFQYKKLSLKYVKDGSGSKRMKRFHFKLWFKDFSQIQMRTFSFPRDMNMNGDLKRFCSCDVVLQGRGNGFVSWARWVGWPPAQPWSISSVGPPESGSRRNLFMSRYIFLWGQCGGKGAGGVDERRWYNRRCQFCSRVWMESGWNPVTGAGCPSVCQMLWGSPLSGTVTDRDVNTPFWQCFYIGFTSHSTHDAFLSGLAQTFLHEEWLWRGIS